MPAVFIMYHATHGIVKRAMMSGTWQMTIWVISAIALGVAAFARTVGMAVTEPSHQSHARA